MTKWLNTTKEDRSKIKKEHADACATFQTEIDTITKKIEVLSDNNKDKLSAREAVTEKINKAKKKGKFLFIPGIVVGIIGALITLIGNVGLGIVAAIAGITLVIIGVVVYNGWKKFSDEYNKADEALSEYDAKKYQLDEKKDELVSEWYLHKKVIDEIDEFERNEKYYRKEAELSTGHVVVFTTSEAHPFESTPNDSVEGKKYDSFTLTTTSIYLNEMLYCKSSLTYFDKQNGVLACTKIEDSGTQKLQILIDFHIGSANFDRITEPIPVRKENATLFVWYHVSTCGQGTTVYHKTYDNLEDFRKAVRLTQDEIMKFL